MSRMTLPCTIYHAQEERVDMPGNTLLVDVFLPFAPMFFNMARGDALRRVFCLKHMPVNVLYDNLMA